MFIIFLLILLIGLAGFAFVFTKALKSRITDPLLRKPLEITPVAAVEPARAPLVLATDVPLQAADLQAREADAAKLVKLEQMIDEKNSMIAQLQKNFQSGDDRDAQMDGLKQILQAQIEELKQQNRQLKTEVERLSEENMDLQTRLYAGQSLKLPVVEHIVIHPAASTDALETASGPVVGGDQGRPENVQVPLNSLSLHDVFGGEEEKNS